MNMSVGPRTVVAVGAGTAAVLYIVYRRWLNDIRVPETFPEADGLRDVLKILKKIGLISNIGERLGFGQRIFLMRRLFTHYFDDGESLPVDPDLQVTYADFDGVPVKLYVPRDEEKGRRLLPGMVYYHGGGCCMGSADEMDGVTRRFAKSVHMVVASVIYRLAPEHVFPAALDDCVAATKYFMKNAATLGVDGSRVAIAGDSSGGYMTAAVSLRLRDDEWSPQPKLQVLLYPALQAVDFRTPSYEKNADDPLLDRPLMITFWLLYAFGDIRRFRLGDFERNGHTTAAARACFSKYLDRSLLPADFRAVNDSPTEDKKATKDDANDALWKDIEATFTNPYFAPLLAPNLKSLPPAYVFTCQQDVVRDEALVYIQRLRNDGVKVTHAHYDCLHALFDLLHLKIASDALDAVCDHVRNNL